MSTLDTFQWFQQTPVGHALGHANHLWGAFFQLIHIVGFILLLSAVVLINLRLFGVGLKRQPVLKVTQSAIPLLWIGLGAAAFSGITIFLSGPVHYYPNEAFWIKIVLLLLAVVFQAAIYNRLVSTQTERPSAAKVAATLSLVLWFGVGIAGRTIGYI